MKKLLLLTAMFAPFTILFADIVKFGVGEKIDFLRGSNFTNATIKIYVAKDVIKKYTIKNEEIFNYFQKTLSEQSDSVNAPAAFEIDFDNGKRVVRCIKKIEKVPTTVKQSCAIKAETQSATIDVVRENSYMLCNFF